jgi:hypothetical protein
MFTEERNADVVKKVRISENMEELENMQITV